MSITQADIHFLKSSVVGSAGGAASATEITPAVLNNLFSSFTDADRVTGAEEIKAWFVQNEHASEALVLPSFYISLQPVGISEYLGIHMDSSDASDSAQGVLTPWLATRAVALKSDGSDSRNCTVIGIAADGTPIEETIALNGTNMVYTTAAFFTVYAIQAASTSLSRTISAYEADLGGAGVASPGSQIRGTIPPAKIEMWLWVATSSKGDGIRRLNLVASAKYGFWDKLVLPPESSGVRPNTSVVSIEEMG